MSLIDALLLDPYPFELYLANRTDGNAGSGTLNDPYRANTAAEFDAILSSLQEPTVVHLGAGTFYTNGYSDANPSAGWKILPGTRIVGAGISTTKLVVQNASGAGHYYAIGHPLVDENEASYTADFCEVADLTIDCGASGAGSSAACGAIRLMGDHVQVNRVRVINWGTKSSTRPCYVIVVLTGDRSKVGDEYLKVETVNAGIQGCIAIEPCSSALEAAITVFHVGGNREATLDPAEAFGKAPYIRNCFVDCGSLSAEETPIDPLTADIRALSMGWCRAGVVEGNHVHNTKFGGPYQEAATTRDIVVRNNLYRNVVCGPCWKLGQTLPAPAATLAALISENSGTTALASVGSGTPLPHGLLDGDRVRIGAGTGAPDAYLGTFAIYGAEATMVNQFAYKLKATEVGSGTGATFQKVFGAANILVERNLIELAVGSTGGIAVELDDNRAEGVTDLDLPDFVFLEAIIRENRIRYIDNQFGSSFAGTAVKAFGVKNLVVRDNIVEVAPTNPLWNRRCQHVRYFENKTPSGALIQGYDGVQETKYSELETESEDALLLTLI